MSHRVPTPDARPATPDLSAPDPMEAHSLKRRRAVVLALNLGTCGGLFAALASILAGGGLSWAEGLMLGGFALTLPWLSIGFWNAVIGLAILHGKRDPVLFVAPGLAAVRTETPVTLRAAVAMTIRNEDPARAVARLRTVQQSLDETGDGRRVDLHLLSDTDDPVIAAEEERLVDAWRRTLARPSRLHYRRRTENTGFKAGNIRDFVEHWGERYDAFVPLDADSVMSGAAILRLLRAMQENPRLGIVQGLVVGMPARSLFARVFQFGMRHGMRSYTTGSAWWQGDCGPFWGHNAAIRLRPFRDHCRLPVLPGKPPLGGHVLSHDQVEAVLMRRAGWEVRVLAEEDESFEENPPALPGFIARDLRWCQGNMQYWRLLTLPGLASVSRWQLGLAILMYLQAVGWMTFIAAGTVQIYLPAGQAPIDIAAGVALFATVITMSLMPKILGVVDVLLRARARRAYGGGWRMITSAVLELTASALLAPAVSLAETRFMAGLPLGRAVKWSGQQRDPGRLSWAEAARGLWPQTVAGAALLAAVWIGMPALLPWVAPVLLAFLGAVPFAVATAAPSLGRLSMRLGLFDIPEDHDLPPVLRTLARLEASPYDPAAAEAADAPADAVPERAAP